jgi:hypothetical protein
MMLGAPAVARDENNALVMIFGTGQYDQLASWNRNRIFSITDTAAERIEVGGGGELIRRVVHEPEVNWWIGDLDSSAMTTIDFDGQTVVNAQRHTDFLTRMKSELENGTQYVGPANAENGTENPTRFWNVGEKLVGRPVIFNQAAYFTTFVPLGDPSNVDDACEEGGSRIWGLKYNFKHETEPEKCAIGRFEDSGSTCTNLNIPYRDYPGEILSGVKIVKRPTCYSPDTMGFELVAQSVDINKDQSGSGGGPPSEDVKVKTVAIQKMNFKSLVAVRFDSWSLVF